MPRQDRGSNSAAAAGDARLAQLPAHLALRRKQNEKPKRLIDDCLMLLNGTGHMMMLEKNSLEIALLIARWLERHVDNRVPVAPK